MNGIDCQWNKVKCVKGQFLIVQSRIIEELLERWPLTFFTTCVIGLIGNLLRVVRKR